MHLLDRGGGHALVLGQGLRCWLTAVDEKIQAVHEAGPRAGHGDQGQENAAEVEIDGDGDIIAQLQLRCFQDLGRQ